MEPATPFLALRSGRPDGTPYTLTVHDLGVVQVPSGRLEASDPYVTLGEGLEVPVPAGTYPVRVTVADVSQEQDGSHLREAYLSVVLTDAPAAEVRHFVPEGRSTTDADGEPLWFGVGVDAGTVGFADALAVRAATAAVDDWYGEVVDHGGPDSWFALQDSAEHLVVGAANAPLPHAGAGENVVLSHSGWGDGFYPVVTTHDAGGALTGVHIDLQVITAVPWWDEDDGEASGA